MQIKVEDIRDESTEQPNWDDFLSSSVMALAVGEEDLQLETNQESWPHAFPSLSSLSPEEQHTSRIEKWKKKSDEPKIVTPPPNLTSPPQPPRIPRFSFDFSEDYSYKNSTTKSSIGRRHASFDAGSLMCSSSLQGFPPLQGNNQESSPILQKQAFDDMTWSFKNKKNEASPEETPSDCSSTTTNADPISPWSNQTSPPHPGSLDLPTSSAASYTPQAPSPFGNAVFRPDDYFTESNYPRPRSGSEMDNFSTEIFQNPLSPTGMNMRFMAPRARANSEILLPTDMLMSPKSHSNGSLARNQSMMGLCRDYGSDFLPKGQALYYEVAFKGFRSDVFIGAPNFKVGDYVKVEADRGMDLGHIVKIASNRDELLSQLKTTSEPGDKRSKDHVKLIWGLATVHELNLLKRKSIEEYGILDVCRNKVLQRNLPMQIIDAELQFDRHKLTFYFQADRRIDFRELVRDLFAIYKTRIWMQQISTDATSSSCALPSKTN